MKRITNGLELAQEEDSSDDRAKASSKFHPQRLLAENLKVDCVTLS
jgi:hypothetical protein